MGDCVETRKLVVSSDAEWARQWKKFKFCLYQLDITRLPISLVEDITSYLDGSALAACSGVCYLWREALNEDFFWQRLCYQDVAGYLETADNLVKPAFQPPPQDEETLEEVCEWRLRYMRQAHLLRNWYDGHYNIQTIYTYDSSISHSGHVFHDNGDHWLILSTRSKTQVWNIQRVPYTEAAVLNYGESYVAGVGGLMLRASNNLLEVFDPRNLLAAQHSPKCEINLTFACFIDGNQRFPDTVETTSDVYKMITDLPCKGPQKRLMSIKDVLPVQDTYSKTFFPDVTVLHQCDHQCGSCSKGKVCMALQSTPVRRVFQLIAKSPEYDTQSPYNYFTLGELFVGYQTAPTGTLTRPKIHFWDLPSGTKVHEFQAPRACSQCLVLRGDSNRPLLLVYIFQSSSFQRNRVSQIFLYDIASKKYTGFCAEVPSKVWWWGMCRDILVVRQERVFHFFNVTTRECVCVKDMDFKLNVGECDLERTQFLLMTKLFYATKYHLHIMDVETQEIVFNMDFNYIVYSLHHVRGKFMIVSSKSSSEVWDIEDKELIFKLPYLFITEFKIDSQAAPMRLLAQSQNEVSIINFW